MKPTSLRLSSAATMSRSLTRCMPGNTAPMASIISTARRPASIPAPRSQKRLSIVLPPTARQIHIPKPAFMGKSQSRNRVYDVVRDPATFHNTLLTSGSNRQVLITLWTASYCSSCKAIAPLIRDIFETETFEFAAQGDTEGVGLVEVVMDAPDAGGLGFEFMITSIPTLLAFGPRRQEPRFTTRLHDVSKMKDREYLRSWIQEEIRKKETGAGGSGSGGAGGILD